MDKVFIVDDIKENIDILVSTLGDQYDLKVATNGETAINLITDDPPDLILLDVMMPEIDGYEVCRRIKENDKTRLIPVIFLTALSDRESELKGISLGAVDFIVKPYSPEVVRLRVQNQMSLKKYRDNLEAIVDERTEELLLLQSAIIQNMGTLAEFRDPETGEHIKRTQYYVKLLAQYLLDKGDYTDYLSDKVIGFLFISAPLHDIGKIGVKDSILLKPGKLTDDEFEEMKKHTYYGKKVLSKLRKNVKDDTFLIYAEEMAYSHHEKWDGSGYPNGLVGDAIPLSGRLMALADVFDALISKRVYKEAFSYEKTKEIIVSKSGKHFDPEIVQAFLMLEEKFIDIAEKLKDNT